MSRNHIPFWLATTFVSISTVIVFASSPARAANNVQLAPEAGNAPVQIPRCAYIGYWGSFHITGQTGTAAYRLGNQQYIADLSLAGANASFYYYRPIANGDPFITMWAFATQPFCGKYLVWFRHRGGWRQYEATRAWGIFGTPGGTVTSTPDGPSNQELLDKLRDLEGKLNDIQPGNSPSLKDLEDQIKARL